MDLNQLHRKNKKNVRDKLSILGWCRWCYNVFIFPDGNDTVPPVGMPPLPPRLFPLHPAPPLLRLILSRAFVVPMMSRPRVRTSKRLLPLGALREKHDFAASTTARWRQSALGPLVGGLQRVPLAVPTRDEVPPSTLDRHSSSQRLV